MLPYTLDLQTRDRQRRFVELATLATLSTPELGGWTAVAIPDDPFYVDVLNPDGDLGGVRALFGIVREQDDELAAFLPGDDELIDYRDE